MEPSQELTLVKHVRDILLNDHGEIPFGEAPEEDKYVIFYFYAVNYLHASVNSDPTDYLSNLIKDAINNNLIDSTIQLAYHQAH